MYYLNSDGVISDVNPNKDACNYTITLYQKDADLNKIVGTCPFIYTNMEALLKDIKAFSGENGDISSWLDNDEVTIVIRKCKVICVG